jgi:hypothetical protein
MVKGKLRQAQEPHVHPLDARGQPVLRDGRLPRHAGSLPEPLRSQMAEGNFNAGRTDHVWQVIPTDWIKAAMNRWVDREAQGHRQGPDERAGAGPFARRHRQDGGGSPARQLVRQGAFACRA